MGSLLAEHRGEAAAADEARKYGSRLKARVERNLAKARAVCGNSKCPVAGARRKQYEAFEALRKAIEDAALADAARKERLRLARQACEVCKRAGADHPWRSHAPASKRARRA
jgi:hypothetical protein